MTWGPIRRLTVTPFTPLSLSLSLSLGFEDSIARDARVLSLTFPSCLMGTMSVRLGPVCLVAIKFMSQAKNSIKNICFSIL